MAAKTLIGTTTTVAPDLLNTYHRNPRRGDTAAIAASLRSNDQYRPIVVNIGSLTGRPNEVLAGNHCLLAVQQLAEESPDDPRWQSVKVHWGDWDDDTCRRIVLADNRTAELGGFDTAELLALLQEVPAIDLGGVGYSFDDLADLTASLQETAGTALNDVLDRPRVGDDGLIEHNDLVQEAAGYQDSATRMIILLLPIPQFIWAQEQFETVRGQMGVESNAEAVLALLAQRTGAVPPEVPVED